MSDVMAQDTGIRPLKPSDQAFLDAFIDGEGSLGRGLAAKAAVVASGADDAKAVDADYVSRNRMMPYGLIPRQIAFVREYVIDHNGAAAAIRAGYPREDAKVTASRLLTLIPVRTYVSQLERDAVERSTMSAQMVLDELGRLGDSDLRDVFDDQGNTKPPHELPTRVAKAIKSMEIIPVKTVDAEGKLTITNTYKYSFWDKPAALNTLAKYHGIVADRPAEDAIASMEIETKRAMRLQILRELAGIAKGDDALVINPDGTSA